MSDAVEEFFSGLARRGYEPLLRHNSGWIRFDVNDHGVIDHWRVTVDQGKETVDFERAVSFQRLFGRRPQMPAAQ